MSLYADRETQRKLIDALNLICDHVTGKLPEGYELTLNIVNGEASASLFNPEGEEIEVTGSDYGISSLDEICVVAIETEKERKP